MTGVVVAERLSKQILLDPSMGLRPVSPDGWARTAGSVNVTYARDLDVPAEARMWCTEVVRMADPSGVNILVEVDTVQRGHRTEGVFSTLRYVSKRMVRESRGDFRLSQMPGWLADLVEEHRPVEER